MSNLLRYLEMQMAAIRNTGIRLQSGQVAAPPPLMHDTPPQMTGSDHNGFYFVNTMDGKTRIEYKDTEEESSNSSLIFDIAQDVPVTFLRYSYKGDRLYWIANNTLYTYRADKSSSLVFNLSLLEVAPLPWTII